MKYFIVMSMFLACNFPVPSPGMANSSDSHITGIVEQYDSNYQINGAVLVVRHGKIVYQEAFGNGDEKIRSFWYCWYTVFELSHYTVEYFHYLLLNIYESLRYCEEGERTYMSVDF